MLKITEQSETVWCEHSSLPESRERDTFILMLKIIRQSETSVFSMNIVVQDRKAERYLWLADDGRDDEWSCQASKAEQAKND